MGVQLLEADFGQTPLFWGITTILSSQQEDEVQLFKSRRGERTQKRREKFQCRARWRKRDSLGEAKLFGHHSFKDSNNKVMTSVKRWTDKIGHWILWWKKILNHHISSGARMIYMYLSRLFYELLAILQSQIKLDSIYISFDLGNTFKTSSKACWNHENTLLRYE